MNPGALNDELVVLVDKQLDLQHKITLQAVFSIFLFHDWFLSWIVIFFNEV